MASPAGATSGAAIIGIKGQDRDQKKALYTLLAQYSTTAGARAPRRRVRPIQISSNKHEARVGESGVTSRACLPAASQPRGGQIPTVQLRDTESVKRLASVVSCCVCGSAL